MRDLCLTYCGLALLFYWIVQYFLLDLVPPQLAFQAHLRPSPVEHRFLPLHRPHQALLVAVALVVRLRLSQSLT
jgi:hypothetical protein